ncbi:helix-turn-helix domain protein [mine drainage metagenome]|uniref:Helix-turn-helix domain protein n=1 Tax=mine drainage metagenome TaxID=410659 RepID=A0A1J5T6L4_9ZZZZ
MSNKAQGSLPLLPSAVDIELAKESSRALSMILATKEEVQKVTIQSDGEKTKVELPMSAFRLFIDILANLSQGNAVQVVPVHAEITTQEAADLLMVSRPYFIKLLDENKIPYRKVGTHRRIRYSDLLDFKNNEEQLREAALDELAAQAQKLGMGY